jgi:hypothetical protein
MLYIPRMGDGSMSKMDIDTLLILSQPSSSAARSMFVVSKE